MRKILFIEGSKFAGLRRKVSKEYANKVIQTTKMHFLSDYTNARGENVVMLR
jgi:hypothetical protein